MAELTPQQRVEVIKTFYLNKCSLTNTRRKLRNFFGLHHVPSSSTIQRVIKNFEILHTLGDVPRSGRKRSVRTPEKVDEVRQSVGERPGTSSRRRAQEMGMSQGSLLKILKKDLHFYPYKIQLTQELQENDHIRRRDWSTRVLQLIRDDPQFWRKIIMSDEAHFDLAGFVNKQNSRYWGTDNPQLIHQRPLHPRRVTVWCAIWAGGIIGPYFFEDARGNAVTVNGDRYRDMLENFLVPELDQLGLQHMWFQQDGATSHTARATIQILREIFPGRIMSKSGDIDWPPRSPDLTAPDFFLWGYLKGKVYTNKPNTIPILKNNIQNEIADITPEVCENVMKNMAERVRICFAARGGHLTDIIFHT
jgi:hypothetical protein